MGPMAKMVTTHMATNALLAKIWLSIFSGLLAKRPLLILQGSNEGLFILSTYCLPGSLLPYSPICIFLNSNFQPFSLIYLLVRFSRAFFYIYLLWRIRINISYQGGIRRSKNVGQVWFGKGSCSRYP